MPIQLTQEQRGYLEQLARGKIGPTRRQKAIALLHLAEGETPEKAAGRAGIQAEDVETLAAHFAELGLDGIGLGNGDHVRGMKVPSLQDDALFEQYRRIIKARRMKRVRQEESGV